MWDQAPPGTSLTSVGRFALTPRWEHKASSKAQTRHRGASVTQALSRGGGTRSGPRLC